LKRTGGIRPIHASASEGVELRDCRRCQKLAPWEGISRTYVIQPQLAHALPLRLPIPAFLIILPVFSSLFRDRRKDDGDAKDEPGQSHESGKVVTIRPHGLASRSHTPFN
jgi:hypothetical protein